MVRRERVIATTSNNQVIPSPTVSLRCSEIWGGIRNVNIDVCTNGLTSSLYAAASGAAEGGDVYCGYFLRKTYCSEKKRPIWVIYSQFTGTCDGQSSRRRS